MRPKLPMKYGQMIEKEPHVPEAGLACGSLPHRLAFFCVFIISDSVKTFN